MYIEQRFLDRQVGSNAEPFAVQLVRYGVPVDLTEATITFRAVDAVTGTAKIDNAAGSGASNGVAQYAPRLEDLDTPGEYRCQMVAAWPDGRVQRSEVIYLRVIANP